MATCEQCVFFRPTRWDHWGRCGVDVPAWVRTKENAVCGETDHPNNFAPRCKCFQRTGAVREVK
jgi:hypothetical protein